MTGEGRAATPPVHLYGDTPSFHPAFSSSWAQHFAMPLYRAKMTWTGFVGSPGYTNMYFLDPDPISASGLEQTAVRLHNFWDAIDGYLPSSVRINLPTVLEEVATATGELLAEHPFEPGTVIAGSGTASFASPAGACINWNTAGLINGRRIRGRTFIVPMHDGGYQSDGTLADAARTAIANAANTYANAGPGLGIDGAIWHRPSGPGASDGAAAGITSATVRDRVAILRSRRD